MLAIGVNAIVGSGVFALPYSSFRFRPSVVGATFAGADQTFVVLSNLADRQTATPLPISAAVDIFDGLSGELLRAGAGARDARHRLQRAPAHAGQPPEADRRRRGAGKRVAASCLSPDR
jgi:hypothetical protein